MQSAKTNGKTFCWPARATDWHLCLPVGTCSTADLGSEAEILRQNRLRQKLDPTDIVQETLIKAHRGWPSLRATDERTVLGWLDEILANTVHNAHRDQHRQKRDAAQEVPLEAVILKYWHDWPLKEIGERLGKTSGAVAALLHRALEKLRGSITSS